MQIGIRQKLVVLLTVTALLPLLASLGVMLVGLGQLRLATFGQTLRMTASANATSLEVTLTKDLQRFHGVFSHNSVIEEALNAAVELPQARRDELDKLWPGLAIDDPLLAKYLHHPKLEALLGQLREEDPRVVKILLTDRWGQLVACSPKCEDFYQADEDWWIDAFHHGTDSRINIPAISRDGSTGVWSVDLCVPVNDGAKFQGMVKIVVSVSGWLQRVDRTLAGTPVAVSLLRDNGTVLYVHHPREGESTPFGQRIRLAPGETLETRVPSWRDTRDGSLEAFAPIRMPSRLAEHQVLCPVWLLGLQLSRDEVLAPTRHLTMIAAIIGLALILAIFFLGLVLAETGLVRRIRSLRHVSRDVAAGDLTGRVRLPAHRPWGSDELDDLSIDFNHMIDQVANSYATLRNANAMRTNFIQIAGHELRTPVTYLLAMARLLRDCTDVERLRAGVATMGAKAHRLEEIVRAIFQLLPETRPGASLRVEPVKVSEILEAVYADCLPFIDRRKQTLRIECPPALEVRGDRGKLRDAVEHLAMNAIKFTPDGGAIRIRASEQPGGFVLIAVQDQGPGIPPDDLPHIFEPFHSVGDVLKHSTGTEGYQKRGIGLGLAVVKHFVELHGGTVQVATGHEGSTFTLVIPAGPRTPPAPDAAQQGAGI